MKEMEIDACVDRLYRLVKGRIQWDNLLPTCLYLGQELEQMIDLPGTEKLEVLQKTLKFAIKDSTLGKEKQEEVIHTIETVVPIIMKAAILASKVPIQRIEPTHFCCR